jgi:single-stranded-DNA-specific exonuclease
MMVEKIWIEKLCDENEAQALKRELGISLIFAKVLLNRQIIDKKTATEFLAPSLKNLMEPLLLKDMDKAVLRISQAIYSKEKIGVFGDYDVDGVCSAALLQQFLTSVNAEVIVTLPHRLTEGYGLSYAGIERLKTAGVGLVITVDCGILAHKQIDYARTLDLDVIVVDHHTVGETLPNAHAIVNPKRIDCHAHADYLCAAGVSFFLALALRRHLRESSYFNDIAEPDVRNLLDLVAIATVCDVVPLIKDNRCIVKAGLRIMRQDRRIGLSALLHVCGIDKNKISSTNLGFHLGPRINAAGRLEDATRALSLMNSNDMDDACIQAHGLDRTNQERRALEEETVAEVCQLIEVEAYSVLPRVLVFYQLRWHPGVVGIVASRIAERYHRPTIIIGEKGKGSGRSIKGVDLHDMVVKASRSLASFGGHAHAIGVTLGSLGVEVFRNDLLSVMEELPAHVFQKKIAYDATISLSDVNLSLVDDLMQLEPFGAHNPFPIVRINNCFFKNLRRVQGGHIKGELEGQDGVISFIGFRMDIDEKWVNCALDVLGVLERNEWQGRLNVQLRLCDFRLCQ